MFSATIEGCEGERLDDRGAYAGARDPIDPEVLSELATGSPSDLRRFARLLTREARRVLWRRHIAYASCAASRVLRGVRAALGATYAGEHASRDANGRLWTLSAHGPDGPVEAVRIRQAAIRRFEDFPATITVDPLLPSLVDDATLRRLFGGAP